MWGLIKSEVYERKVGRADELLAGTLDAAASTNKREDQLRRTTRDLRTRVAMCTEYDGGNFKKLIVNCNKGSIKFYVNLLIIRKNTVCQLMWLLYMYTTIPCIAMTWYCIHPAMSPQVPRKSKGQHRFSLLVFTCCRSGCDSGLGGLPVCCDVYCFFHGWRHIREGCWSVYVVYDLLHTGVYLLWLSEFWIVICAWWLCWTCWRNPTVLLRCSISGWWPLCRRLIYFL